MKRFYCTICQRIKRVRVIPASVRNHGDDVRMREGTCAWHTRARSITARHSFNQTHEMKVGK